MRSSSNTISLPIESIVEDEESLSFAHEELMTSLAEKRLSREEADLSANESKGKTKLEISLTKLVRLIANITESHTSAIFVADTKNKILHSLAHHSLSRDFIEGVTIPYGRGLVGWTAENKVRITVCPFENDASTLLYYPSDQSLKSFIAVPILSKDKELFGVIACDSKKSYAFAKITEKILTECAAQAELLINLHQANERLSHGRPHAQQREGIDLEIDKLRLSCSEEDLFENICKIPQTIIERDAFIALVTSHEGYGEPTFYSHSPESRTEHHLLDLVCKNKKIISSERSVHVMPSDDIKARSFLSVPFHVNGEEAGALNILSAAFKPFSTHDIQALEKIALTLGRELERFRSKAIARARQIGPSMLPWNHFLTKGKKLLGEGGTLSLLRLQFDDLLNLESKLGVQICCELHEQLLRFVKQLAPTPMLVSAPYGTSIFVFGETESIESVAKRIKALLSRIHSVNGVSFSKDLNQEMSALILESLNSRIISASRKAVSIEDLLKEVSSTKFSPKVISSPHVEARTPQFYTQVKSPEQTSDQLQKDSGSQSYEEEENEITTSNSLVIDGLTAKKRTQVKPITLEEIYEDEDSHSTKTSPLIPEEIKPFRSGPTQIGVTSRRKTDSKSIEEFVLGDSIPLKGKGNARFW